VLENCSIRVVFSLPRLCYGKMDSRLCGNDSVTQELTPTGIRPDGTMNKAPALEVFGKEGQQGLMRK
jgi:hypothetical protein